MLIRVPFHDSNNFQISDKFKPDDREIEETDPIFNI